MTGLYFYPFGTEQNGDKVSFVFHRENKKNTADAGIVLFDLKNNKEIERIPFEPEESMGNVSIKTVAGYDWLNVGYMFYDNGVFYPDKYAKSFVNRKPFGEKQNTCEWIAGIGDCSFDWSGDVFPAVPYCDMIQYCMHVRGFSKHVSSGVKAPGTFAGLIEKIPYLKSIGVTTLEVQPIYEFPEKCDPTDLKELRTTAEEDIKTNYWGYIKGFYFAPKAAYCAEKDSYSELCRCVKKLHANGIEIIMQMYFPANMSSDSIINILRYWHYTYHIDGFRLLGDGLPVEAVLNDNYLCRAKIMASELRRADSDMNTNAAEYTDGFYYEMRKFLKGDDNKVSSALYQMKHTADCFGSIHFLSSYYGFTLADLVAYNQKHNEDNGEENRDGADFNCSWNCGEEGPTKSRKINKLRVKQIKNAISFLLLSASTPCIFMGDEFGNTQKGNNNPYCQDNEITWLDWSLTKKNREILDFWKNMTAFRKNHPILHMQKELKNLDVAGIGYPDLSYHSDEAWKLSDSRVCRHVGLMYCEDYAEAKPAKAEKFLYIACNMHWESHDIALPILPKNFYWKPLFSTDIDEKVIQLNTNAGTFPPRSLTVLQAVCEEKPAKKGKKL